MEETRINPALLSSVWSGFAFLMAGYVLGYLHGRKDKK